MRELGDEQVSRNFAGSLLVAHPNMVDPNFRRTVLFVSEHEPNEGALGVIINRPLDRPVAELVSDTPPAGLADVPVFLGGPVGKNQLMFAAFEWQKGGAGLKLNHNVAFDEPSDLLRTSWMTAHSSTARTGPPAITPVPAAAGRSRTTPAAASP